MRLYRIFNELLCKKQPIFSNYRRGINPINRRQFKKTSDP